MCCSTCATATWCAAGRCRPEPLPAIAPDEPRVRRSAKFGGVGQVRRAHKKDKFWKSLRQSIQTRESSHQCVSLFDRLTTGASAAGAQARARTIPSFRCVLEGRGAQPELGTPPPLGCMRGLGRNAQRTRLAHPLKHQEAPVPQAIRGTNELQADPKHIALQVDGAPVYNPYFVRS